MKHRLISSISDGRTDTQMVLHSTSDPYAFKALLARVADVVNGRPVRRRTIPGNAKPCTLVSLADSHVFQRHLSSGRVPDPSVFKPGGTFASTTLLAQALGMSPRAVIVSICNERRRRRNSNEEPSPEFRIAGWVVRLHDRLSTFHSATIPIPAEFKTAADVTPTNVSVE